MEELTNEMLENYILQHQDEPEFEYWVNEAQAILND